MSVFRTETHRTDKIVSDISYRGSGNILRKHSKAVGGQPCSAVVSYVSEKLYI